MGGDVVPVPAACTGCTLPFAVTCGGGAAGVVTLARAFFRLMAFRSAVSALLPGAGCWLVDAW